MTAYNINCIWTLEFPRRVPTACSHGAKDFGWFPRHPNVPTAMFPRQCSHDAKTTYIQIRKLIIIKFI